MSFQKQVKDMLVNMNKFFDDLVVNEFNKEIFLIVGSVI